MTEATRLAKIKRQAMQEIEEERFQIAVDQEKVRIRARRWWHVLLPYTITFVRRTQ